MKNLKTTIVKKMKNFQLLLAVIVLSLSANKSIAQVEPVKSVISNPNSYWQLSSRIGYDIPLFRENFKYIEYKGGIMAGLSVNRYWNRWGIQGDFDYIRNTPVADFPNPTNYLEYTLTQPALVPLSLNTTKTGISRMFVGIGPAYKYQSPNNKFTAEFAVLGGLGVINGGEILVEGSNPSLSITPIPLTYHSGFDNEKVFTMKAQARVNYFFDENWGVNAGVYYMNHFDVKESQKNQILIDKGYSTSSDPIVYFYELGTVKATVDSKDGPVEAEGFNVNNQNTILRVKEQDLDQRSTLKLQSVGVFAGLTYKFTARKKPVVKEEKVVEKYCIQVTAKDKFTKENLANTDVAIKNNNGVVVGTAKSDAFGVVKFCDLLPENYTISGIYNEVALEGNTTQKAEFVNGKTVVKEILYADRNFIVKGKAVECNTSTSISGISVILENKSKAFMKTSLTDTKGEFLMKLPEAGMYSLYGKKENYFSQTEEVNASNYDRNKTLFVKLEICAEKADCGKEIGLKNILFDLAKYNIKEEAKVELNKLVEFMKDNPQVKVEVGSHTDSRASSDYNQTLSQNRANSSVDYIVQQGIARDRISAKGYGETKLLNSCSDGVSCSEDQHAINRRTEFKVICPQ